MKNLFLLFRMRNSLNFRKTAVLGVLALLMIFLTSAGQDRDEISVDPADVNLPIRDMIDKYYTRSAGTGFYMGCAPRGKAIPPGEETAAINREFSYITPDNHFKQAHVHPEPDVWSWEQADQWIASAKENKQVIRIHGPISPQSSGWAKADKRTAAELDRNMREHMTELCRHFNQHSDVIKWMDVVNEIYAIGDMKDNKTGEVKYRVGDWFGPFTGTKQFQNPWTTIGFDESTPVRVPLYIRNAFEIATQEAPDLKLIINQNGQFEPEVWENMKKLVVYLRERDLRVDGVGWQAHVKPEWEKEPDNLERLASFIEWCHANALEFHITELNIWSPLEQANEHDSQADTFTAIIRTLVQQRHTGVVAVNLWYMRSAAEARNDGIVKISPWASDGTPLPAVTKIKQMLLEEAKK